MRGVMGLQLIPTCRQHIYESDHVCAIAIYKNESHYIRCIFVSEEHRSLRTYHIIFYHQRKVCKYGSMYGEQYMILDDRIWSVFETHNAIESRPLVVSFFFIEIQSSRSDRCRRSLLRTRYSTVDFLYDIAGTI